MEISDYVSQDLLEKYDFYNYNHALEIITQAFPSEWAEIEDCLRQFSITTEDLREPGGNESNIPPIIEAYLNPRGWKEIRISGDMIVHIYPRKGEKKSVFSETPIEERHLNGFIDGHNIDHVKNRIAIDMEWNSKDQTFDRDLLAMRTYYDCDIISAGIIITRSKELDDVFDTIYDYNPKNDTWNCIKRKYGASTTWIGKLLYRLESRRNGGCPILAISIKKKCISDWEEGYTDEHAPRNNC